MNVLKSNYRKKKILKNCIAVSLDELSMKNVKGSEQMLLFTVYTAVMCAKQPLALCGHCEYKIEFSHNTVLNIKNVENVIGAICWLTEINEHLRKHLPDRQTENC